MKVKMMLSFLLVVVSIVLINSVFAFTNLPPLQRLWLSAAVGMLVGMGLGYVVSANLMKGLSALSSVAREVASGDLTKEIDASGDEGVAELANAFKSMVWELKGIVGLVQQGKRLCRDRWQRERRRQLHAAEHGAPQSVPEM